MSINLYSKMEKAINILELKAVRITPMRQLLLEYFLEQNGTFSLIELENIFPKSDRITIYRTLKTFEKKGIIHSISYGKGEMKYALCSEQCTSLSHIDQHPHFQCERCKRITCMSDLIVPNMELPKEYLPKGMDIMIKGLCPNCR